jgi:aldose sugar dehydrogenase
MKDLFVDRFHDVNIYRFKIDQKRTGLLLDYPLEDKVSNVKNETQPITFAKGFGGITDLKVGSEGYLYILSLYAGGMIVDLLINLAIYVYSIQSL